MIVMGQHQRAPNTTTEMASCNDHDHVRVVDHVLDRVRRRHLSRHRRVHWHSQCAELAADVQRHSSRQRQYSTSTLQSTALYSLPSSANIPCGLTRLPEF